MAKTNLIIAPKTKQEWINDTSDFFTLRLSGARAILIALSSNIDEYESGDGRATDEAITLAIQHVQNELFRLERLSYELEDHATVGGLGDLSLKLMWARALAEILSEMFGAEGWKINLGSQVLAEYLCSIARLLDEAHQEAIDIHTRRFPAHPVAA